MRCLPIIALALSTSPVVAQEAMDHSGMDHGAMDHASMEHGAADQSFSEQVEVDHSQMDHSSMDHGEMDHSQMDNAPQSDDASQVDHAGMDHSMHHGASEPTDAADTPGDVPPPPVPTEHAADAVFPPSMMAMSRHAMMAESRFRTTAAIFDIFEYRAHKGEDGYRVEGAFWTGGDTDRAVLAFDGEGAFGEAPESVELDAYWSHALDPYFNLQLGLRLDLRPDPERTYALLGVQGLAPYWIEVEAQLFVSNKGDVHLSATAAHDIRVTQNFVVEPEVKLGVAMQDVPELGIGAGFDTLELSARARYELTRNFAPYVGISWEKKLGDSARFARLEGERPSVVSFLAGLRFWF